MDKTKIKNLIIKIASEEGVDPAIALAIAENESNFNPNAHRVTKDEDSYGLFQINKKSHPDYKGGFDPEKNIRYGIRYFKGQLARAKGNVPLALAAYNGGWGGRNYKDAKDYAQRVNAIATKKYDKVALNNTQTPTLYGEAVKAGSPTGAASGLNMNVPDPERPDYMSLFKNTEVDPTGASRANLTQREVMALKNITAPIQPTPDLRPNVVIGQDENGKPVTVTASQYNEMLNQADAQKIEQLNQNLQQQISQLPKAEVQLGGRNAYDTVKGLYSDLMNNDPRAQLMTLTPEQALDVRNRLNADYNWGGNKAGLSAADYYAMMNSLENNRMDYNNAMALANSKYNLSQNLIKDAMTLAGNNKDLADTLIKAAQSGNQDVIQALQKTQEARIKAEADYQKEQLSGYNTLRNTQQTGLNAFMNQAPKTEAEAINNFNTFKNNRYAVDTNKYGRDVGAVVDLSLPEVKAEAEYPLESAKLQQNQQKIGIQQQNADTARASAAGNILSNGMFNPQGFTTGSQNVPAIRNILGNPTPETSNSLFGLTPPANGRTPKMIDFFGLFNQD